MQILSSDHWRLKETTLYVDCRYCEQPFLVANGIMPNGAVIGRISCPQPCCGWEDWILLDGFNC